MPRILVVDDSAFARARLATMLRAQGYEVDEAETGDLALVKYQRCFPDLTLIDVTMPGIDGFATTRAVLLVDPGAVVIMMSAQYNQALIDEAQRVGARGFLNKAWSTAALRAAIHDILRDRSSVAGK